MSKTRTIAFGLGLLFAAACSAAHAQEPPAGAAQEAPARKVRLAFDFEDGKGAGSAFKGNWHSQDAEAATLALEAPAGAGNDSEQAACCRLTKSRPWIGVELPVHGTPAEPMGWDGNVSFKLYNGGFASFYVLYLPIWPSDVTFHRAYFEAPKGQWTTVSLPFDKFLYHGHRPRRGTVMEYLVFVAEGPGDEKAFFQFDDFVYFETQRAGQSAPKPRPPAAEGVVYEQNFDDPADFDVEAFYPTTKNCNVFRVPGGLDAGGKPIAEPKEDGPGCLKIQAYKDGDSFRAGRRISFRGSNTVIECDVLIAAAEDFGLVARSESKGRFRVYARPQPEPDKWTHCVFRADELAPFGMATAAAAAARPGKEEAFFELTFHAVPKDSKAACVLVDNLTIRAQAGTAAGQGER